LIVDVEKSLNTLNHGGVILYPTDTVWGIGCDACNSTAIERIYAIKRRNDARAMIVLVDSFEMLFAYVEHVPEIAKQLIEQSQRPLTLIYPTSKNLTSNITGADGSIAIRIVNEPFCRHLIKLFGKPLVSTSANISGGATPTIFNDISEEIKSKVDYTVRWRQNDMQPAIASSIIKLNKDGSYNVLR